MTGENIDIKMGKEALHLDLYEAKNIARCGCNFTQGFYLFFFLFLGNGTAIVFSTGDVTFFGSIAKSTTSIKRPPSLLRAEIKRLIVIMSIVAAVLGAIFFILSLSNGFSLI